MKIKDMTQDELCNAVDYMMEPDTLKFLSSFNFDPDTWKSKFYELIEEQYNRFTKDDDESKTTR